MKKTIVITGGAGFIGSHLCKQFLKKTHKVFCLDNLLTGSKDNILHLLKEKNFKFLKVDVAKKIDEKLLPKKIDYILHFASPAGPNPNSPKSYLKYPIKTYLVNSIGTHYLLNLAKKTGAQFLFASTSEVYGDPKVHPQKETYNGNVNTLGPRACYDEAKRFGEMATMTFGRKHKVKTKIIRIFNTYGPRMNPDDGRVVPQFIVQALKNKPITVYGKGNQTRSFCYIDDLVKAILKAVFKAKPYEVFNIGSNKEIEIIYLAKAIKKLTDSKSKITYKDLPKDDPEKRRPDLTKARNELNWMPETSLKDGLEKTIKYFKKQWK